jgi:hypothetical protein
MKKKNYEIWGQARYGTGIGMVLGNRKGIFNANN